ncbi:MAG: hypothetical protein H5U04_05315 [Firmicutes bacterium]|nr:hypothetical protein [Bacillota bacterium]
MPKRLTRAELPVEQTWNLADIFPTVEAWEAELAAVSADMPTVTRYAGRLGEGAGTLLACLEALEELQERFGRVASYALLFEPVRDGQGNELSTSFAIYEGDYERSPDTVLRRNAFASFTKRLKAYQNTYAATWATEVRKNVVMARLRGYPSATHMILDR